VNREHRILPLEGISHLVQTVLRCHGTGRDEQHHVTTLHDALSDGIGPAATGTDTLVVPDIEPLLVQPLELGIDAILVVVGIAHEDEGVVPQIGGNGFFGHQPSRS
jgi:hypothetical protein